jgi:ubiquinone/menaquinone biosynthesis C-methylase UbiE
MNIQNWNKSAKDIEFSLEIDDKIFDTHLSKESKILDIGCGYGRISNQIYALGYNNIIGVDSSIGFINRGKREFPHLNLLHNSTGLLPFEESEFDTVILCAVLTCIPEKDDQIELLNEIERVLKSNGVIIATEFMKSEKMDYSSDGSFYSALNIKMKHFDIEEIKNLFKNFYTTQLEIQQAKTIDGSPIESINYIGKLN